MTPNTPLPETTKKRIDKNADTFSDNYRFDYAVTDIEQGYIQGATAEALRALVLVEALEEIGNGPHNDELAFNFGMRVQDIARAIIKQYNSLP